MRTSPKIFVYQRTTSRKNFGYRNANAPCPSINNVIGMCDVKKIRNAVAHPVDKTFIIDRELSCSLLE
jgi:hypothetical protein